MFLIQFCFLWAFLATLVGGIEINLYSTYNLSSVFTLFSLLFFRHFFLKKNEYPVIACTEKLLVAIWLVNVFQQKDCLMPK